MTLIIGVTGSIAAGKSHLCRYLVEHHGAIHVDADHEIHQLYAPGTPGFDRVVAEFGEEVIGPDGAIDRRVLGARVFGNAVRMEALRTAIGDIPAYFRNMLDRWRADLPRDAVGIFEAVNLFTNDYMTRCHAAWLVVCEPRTASDRIVAHRRLSREEAEQRLSSARPWREQAPLADHVFHNDGPIESFEAEIETVFTESVASFRAGTLPPPRWVTAGHPGVPPSRPGSAN